MARWQVDCRCGHHCHAWWAWFQQPAPPTSRLFAHCLLSGSNAQPRWRLSPPTLSFKNALQKPTGDVTDTMKQKHVFYSLCCTRAKALAICSNQYEIPIWFEQEANCSEIWTYCSGKKKLIRELSQSNWEKLKGNRSSPAAVRVLCGDFSILTLSSLAAVRPHMSYCRRQTMQQQGSTNTE